MRKHAIRTLLAALLMSLCFSLSAYAESATVSGSEVNLRSGPGTNYRTITTIGKGSTVTVLDRSAQPWYEVDYFGDRDFIYSSYLSLGQDVYLEDIESLDSSEGYINDMYVRFRSGPGTGYSVLAEYNQGKAVTITGSAGDWTECVIDGRTGYIYSQYISSGSYTPIYQSSADIYQPGFTGSDNDNGFLSDFGGSSTPVKPAPTQTPILPEPTAQPVPESKPAEQRSGFINGDSVRFRSGPGTGYSIIDTYDKGTALIVTAVAGDWAECIINGQTGYVFAKYVSLVSQGSVQIPQATPVPTATPVEPEQPVEQLPPVENVASVSGYISGNNVRMRESASMSSRVLRELFYGNAVTITGYAGEWTAVIYEGEAGYVYSSYVKEGSYSNTVAPDVGGSAEGRQVAEFALQFVGYNYCWGGKSPDTGFDCSGLVYYCYQQFGYTLNRVACDQANNGVHVDASELQPGDILCFYSSGSYIGHVGIYIGNNQFVHAGNSSTGVIISELSGSYASRGFEARRIIN